MFCCLTISTTRALLCVADVEFGIQVIVEAVVACPEPEHCHFPQCKIEPIFPDLVVHLLHVYPHHQNMLFVLKAILNLLGSVGHLAFSRTVLLKACLLWSDDDVLLQVPYQASVDQSFHEFARTAGEAGRTKAVCICLREITTRQLFCVCYLCLSENEWSCR